MTERRNTMVKDGQEMKYSVGMRRKFRIIPKKRGVE